MVKTRITTEVKKMVIKRVSKAKTGEEMPYLRPRKNLVARVNLKPARCVKKRAFALFTPRIRKMVVEFEAANPLTDDIQQYKQQLFEHVHSVVHKIKYSDLEHWIVLHPFIIPRIQERKRASSHQSVVSIIDITDDDEVELLDTSAGNKTIAILEMESAVQQLLRVDRKYHRKVPCGGTSAAGIVAAEISSFMEFIHEKLNDSARESLRLDAPVEFVTMSAQEQDSFRELTKALMHVAKLIRLVYRSGPAVRAQLVHIRPLLEELLSSLRKVLLPVSHAEALKAFQQSLVVCKSKAPS